MENNIYVNFENSKEERYLKIINQKNLYKNLCQGCGIYQILVTILMVVGLTSIDFIDLGMPYYELFPMMYCEKEGKY